MNTLYALFANKKERDAMLAFLRGFDWSTLATSEEATSPLTLNTGEDMGLGARLGGRALGFQGNDFPQWVWAAVAWMASRSSYRVHQWAVIIHNDDEIPVLAAAQFKHSIPEVCFVDDNGHLVYWKERDLPRGPDPQTQMQFLQDLSVGWGRQRSKR